MLLRVKNLAAFVLITLSPLVFSENGNCWIEAGERYNVDPWLLFAIGEVESGLDPMAVNQNETTKDIGLMQINSFWNEPLLSYGITETDLYDACTSINIGAWVLAQSFIVFGYTWEGVGAYNAGTAKTEKAYQRRMYYANKVRKQYKLNATKYQQGNE